ncbi:hypothetical protein AAC387_Pa04g1255 [Persea americana]
MLIRGWPSVSLSFMVAYVTLAATSILFHSKKSFESIKPASLREPRFERLLAAEALRRNEIDTQRALDDLTNPEKNAVLQQYIESKKRKRPRQALEADIEVLKDQE